MFYLQVRIFKNDFLYPTQLISMCNKLYSNWAACLFLTPTHPQTGHSTQGTTNTSRIFSLSESSEHSSVRALKDTGKKAPFKLLRRSVCVCGRRRAQGQRLHLCVVERYLSVGAGEAKGLDGVCCGHPPHFPPSCMFLQIHAYLKLNICCSCFICIPKSLQGRKMNSCKTPSPPPPLGISCTRVTSSCYVWLSRA